MKIGNRINARKIVLSYMYQHCFFYKLLNQGATIDEILFIDNVFKTDEDIYVDKKEEFISSIKEYSSHEAPEELDYIISSFFDKRSKEDIDLDYVIKV
jgi:hypothetical protein